MANICTNKLELSVSKSGEKIFLDEDGDFNFNVEELLPASEDFSVFNYPFEVTLDKVSYDNVSRITGEKLTTFFVTFETKGRLPMDLYKKNSSFRLCRKISFLLRGAMIGSFLNGYLGLQRRIR